MKKVTFITFLFLFNFSFALTGAKYLIITPDNYVTAVQPLADWKTKKGVKAKVVPLSVTGSSASQIKNYIVNAYNTWDIRPEYILLAGFGTILPVNGSSDDYYADITGNYRIELSVGRLPFTNLDQCNLLVSKILGYERTPYIADTLWFRKGTTIVNEDPQPDQYYQADCRYIRNLMLANGFVQTESISDLYGHNSTTVMNAINDGRGFVAYRGQAVSSWYDPFRQIDPGSLTNGFKLPVVVSGTCVTMYFTSTGAYGDRFMLAGTAQNPKGAEAYFGTTGIGTSVYRSTVTKGFFKAIFEEKITCMGDAAKRAKFILDSLYNNQTRYAEWNLFGDPELNLWTGIPVRLTVLHDTIIETRPQTFTVTVKQGTSPLPGALVCIMMDTLIYQSTYTNSSGIASFNINPPTAGSMSVTVTGRNIVPYEKNVTVRPGIIEHDVGVLSIIEPSGIIALGTNVIPRVKVKNFSVNSDSFSITFRIGTVYSETISSITLGAGETTTVSFPSWTAVVGNHTVIAFTLLENDQYRANDTAYGSVNVVIPNDVGVDAIVSPDSFHPLNVTLIPTAKIKNYGTSIQTNFTATCSIVSSNGTVKYINTQTISSLAPGDTIRVNFGGWTPTISEQCTIKMRTNLITDQNPDNDAKTRVTQMTTLFIVEGFNIASFPPAGWQSIIIQGSYNWERRTFNHNPDCTPYEGDVMASYPSVLAVYGSMARLISPPISLGPSSVACSLKFYMYHDDQYSGGGHGPDSVKVEYSTNGTDFYRVAAFRRYEPTNGWQEHAVLLGPFSGTIYFSFLAYSEYGNNMNIDYVRLFASSAIAEQELNPMSGPFITTLNGVKPNPATNGSALISFSLAEPAEVVLKIYDASGKLVKNLVNIQLASGNYNYTWNGKDELNRAVAKGIYFCTLQTSKQNFTKKMVFTR